VTGPDHDPDANGRGDERASGLAGGRVPGRDEDHVDRERLRDREPRQHGIDAGSPAEALRRLDEQGGAAESGEVQQERTKLQRLRRQLLWVVVAMFALGLVGFGGGWLFAQFSGPTAARMMLGDRVEVERETPGDPPAAQTAPTWGDSDEDPLCGVAAEPVDPAEQIAVLDAGGVVMQYRPDDVTGDDRRLLRTIPEDFGSHVLVAPNPELDHPVVATAWEHRLAMDHAEEATAHAFVEGYGSPDAPPDGCPLVR
jgi:hypothetical protein